MAKCQNRCDNGADRIRGRISSNAEGRNDCRHEYYGAGPPRRRTTPQERPMNTAADFADQDSPSSGWRFRSSGL